MRSDPSDHGALPGDALASIAAHERSIDPLTRHTAGVHYTPPRLARFLVEAAIDALGRVPRTICDPTCGAGSFLVAAADALADRGVDPVEIVEHRLVGAELDPDAALVARGALQQWCEQRGARNVGARRSTGGVTPRIEVADTLVRTTADWVGRPEDGFDLVIGNPPFLNQLGRGTTRSATTREAVRRRFGNVGAYVDSAALFLLGALDLVGTDGVVAMLQPQSFLAAQDTAAVRAELLRRARLVTLWSSDDVYFDAAVRVCAPVFAAAPNRAVGEWDLTAPIPGSGAQRASSGQVTVAWGLSDRSVQGAVTTCTMEAEPTGQESWGRLFAAALGLPSTTCHGGPLLGSLAGATAGFRDEFYALRDAAVDTAAPGASGPDELDAQGWPRLVTVGMIDPGRLSWGERPRRFGGRTQLAPRLDTAALSEHSPRVAAWAKERLVPKVLVATQTRVVEAVADPAGRWVPVTPTISVEPLDRDDDPVRVVWLLAAALLAPPVSARALATHLGAGLSPGALRWSARSVLQVELPSDQAAWNEGAALARELATCPSEDRAEVLARLGRTMCAAHGLRADDEVYEWWLERAVRAGARSAQPA